MFNLLCSFFVGIVLSFYDLKAVLTILLPYDQLNEFLKVKPRVSFFYGPANPQSLSKNKNHGQKFFMLL